MYIELEKVIKTIEDYRDSENVDDTVMIMMLTGVVQMIKKAADEGGQVDVFVKKPFRKQALIHSIQKEFPRETGWWIMIDERGETRPVSIFMRGDTMLIAYQDFNNENHLENFIDFLNKTQHIDKYWWVGPIPFVWE